MSYYECRCSDPRGLKVTVSRGRVLRICDDCKGSRYECYSAPITRRATMPIQSVKRPHKRLLLSA